jgi:N-acetylneuraminic acid mutarotase
MRFSGFLIILFLSFPAFANMVYLHQKGDERRVVLANDDGQFIKYLTPKGLDVYHPEISTDGRYVAYSAGIIEPGNTSLRIEVLDLVTEEIEIWTSQSNQNIHAEFSGDGRYLFFSGPKKVNSETARQQIHRIDLFKERTKSHKSEKSDRGIFKVYSPKMQVLETELHAYFPAVSSDGNFVVFHQTKDPSSKKTKKSIWSYDYNFGKLERITPKGVHALVPSLSWDDKNVVYVGLENGQWDIFRLDLSDKKIHQVTNSPEREFTPVYAADGRVYFTYFTGKSQMDLDIYSITAEEVEGNTFVVDPKPFVAIPGTLEYVPAFSGDETITLIKESNFPAPARSSFASVSHNGRIYVIGGHQGPEHTYPKESFLNLIDIYDYQTNQWYRGAPMPSSKHGFEAIVHNEYIYVFGGFTYSENHEPKWKSINTIERYDILNNSWEVLPTKLNLPRSSNVAMKVGEEVYLIGGWDSTPQAVGDKEGRFHSKIEVFNLRTLQANLLTVELQLPLRRAFTAVKNNEEIILLGGISEGSSHFDWLDNVTVFDTKTKKFSERAPLPFKTFAPGAEFYNGEIYLFGGMNPNFKYVNSIYKYSYSKQNAEWENTGRFLSENKGFPIASPHPLKGIAILGGHKYKYDGRGNIEDSPVSTFEWLR